MCEKSGIFNSKSVYQRIVPVPLRKKLTVPTYRTRTITEKAYRASVPYFLAKIEAYRTVPYRTAILGNDNVSTEVGICAAITTAQIFYLPKRLRRNYFETVALTLASQVF